MPCSRRPSRIAVVLALAAAGAAAGAAAQDAPRASASDITVSAVTIAVVVQDRRGRFVEGLAARDFKILENGQARPITYFRSDSAAAVGLTVLLDVSGSMALQGRLDDCRTALEGLAASLRPADQAALLLFADGDVEVAAGPSPDRAVFLAELRRAKAYGQTALNDAVAVSPEFARRAAHEKKGLVLLTDGIENGSEMSPEKALEIARRVDVPIYVVGYRIPLSEQALAKYKRGPALTAPGLAGVLRRFAEATGGLAWFPEDAAGVAAALAAVREDLGRQYIVGYTTTQGGADYRRIKVVTSDPKHRVRTRQGY